MGLKKSRIARAHTQPQPSNPTESINSTSDPLNLPASDPISDPPNLPISDPPSDPISDPPSDPISDPPSDPISDPPSDPISDSPSDPPSDPTSDPPSLPPPSSQAFSLNDDSIREISEANNLTAEEVGFLWQQFSKYQLNVDNQIECDSVPFTDPYSKNVLKRIPRKDDNLNLIDFPSYAQYLAKWKNSNGLSKSYLLFQVIFGGQPITKPLCTKLISLVYTDMPQSEKEELAETIIKVMDTKSSGVIDQDDFVEYFAQEDARSVINEGIKLELK